MITIDNIYIRLIDMPDRVHGFVMEDPDGGQNIYLNKNDCSEIQHKALRHEMLHVKRMHLTDYTKTVKECEEEANGESSEA